MMTTNRFEFLEQIGRGGMGVVWKACDTESGDIVAVKQLHAGFEADEDFLQRFEREVEITRRISSPNVVQVLGFGKQNGSPFLAMELVEGESLREMIKRRGTLPWAEVRAIGRQLAAGLAAAHAEKVIHRDVKPSNVLIGKDGVAKLADFGISRAGDMTRLTRSSTMLGTPAYMPPDADEDERSDLYSLGCVLYEALTGAPPFEGKNQTEYFQRHANEAPALTKLPSEARPILGWLLQKDPKSRPQSAATLQAVLMGTASPPRNTQQFRRLGAQPRRRMRVGAAVAGFILIPVLIGGGVVAGLALGGGGEGDNPAGGGNEDVPTVESTVTTGGADGARTGTSSPASTASVPPTSQVTATLPATGTIPATASSSPTVQPTITAPAAPTSVPTSAAGSSPLPTATWTATHIPIPTPTWTATRVLPTATWTATRVPPTATWTPIPPTATWTPIPAPSYSVQAWLDQSSYRVGDQIGMCYRLYPEGTPFHVEISQTQPVSKYLFGGPDTGVGGGDCISGPSGSNHVPYFELQITFSVNGVVVGTASAGAPVSR